MNWGVYILKCGDDTFYTGITTDINRRMQKHRSGKGAKYTRGRAPLTLVFWEPAESYGKALQREYALKQLTRGQKIQLIEGNPAKQDFVKIQK